MRSPVVLLASVALLVACDEGPVVESTEQDTVRVLRSAEPGSPGKLELSGDLAACAVEFDADLPLSFACIGYVDGGGRSGPALGGHLVSVEGSYLSLGSTTYGPLDPTSRIRIDTAGVHANGELLGPLP